MKKPNDVCVMHAIIVIDCRRSSQHMDVTPFQTLVKEGRSIIAKIAKPGLRPGVRRRRLSALDQLEQPCWAQIYHWPLYLRLPAVVLDQALSLREGRCELNLSFLASTGSSHNLAEWLHAQAKAWELPCCVTELIGPVSGLRPPLSGSILELEYTGAFLSVEGSWEYDAELRNRLNDVD